MRSASAAHDGAVVKFVSFVLHHLEELVLGETVSPGTGLLRTVQSLCVLVSQFLRGFALRRGRVGVFAISRAVVQLSQV